MKKVDIHTHLLPRTWPNLKERYGYGGWVQLQHGENGVSQMVKDSGQLFRTVDANLWDLNVRLKDMDATGMQIQVLSTVPVMFSYWAQDKDALDLSRMLNDHIAESVRKYPNRFVGLGTVPLQAPELAAEELKRCVNELGLAGVEIGSHINNWNLDAKELYPFYKTAEDLGCAIFVHPWDMESTGRMQKYWLPWLIGMPTETAVAISTLLFGGVLEHFPSLRFCFAHGGGSFPLILGRIAHGFEVRRDLCATDTSINPKENARKIYVDSLVHDAKALQYVLETLGEENVILGSDYPFPLGENIPGSMIASFDEFSIKLKNKLLHENALKFLNIPPSQISA